MDSAWLSVILVVAAVPLVALGGWLIVVYETRRAARIAAQREAERTHPV